MEKERDTEKKIPPELLKRLEHALRMKRYLRLMKESGKYFWKNAPKNSPNNLPDKERRNTMAYVLLIVETPSSEGNLDSQIFFDTLRALSELSRQNKGCQLLTGNVLQIPIDTDLNTLFDVLGILKMNRRGEGPRYKSAVLIEPLQLHDQGQKEV